MEKGTFVPELIPELSPNAGAQAFDSYKEGFPDYTAEELLAAFEVKLHDAAWKLIEAYNSAGAGDAERRVAMLEYGAMAMGKYNLLYEVTHNPYAPPKWLDIAKSDLRMRTEEDSAARAIVERTPIFSQDESTQHALNDLVSASVVPQGDYTKLELARGLASGRISVQPF